MKLYTVRGDDGEAIGVFYARYPIDLCEVMDRFCDSVPTERCIYKEAAHGTAFFVSPKQRDDVDPDTGPLLFHAATDDTNGIDEIADGEWKLVPYAQWQSTLHSIKE
jgi:hypothetical protein